MSSKFSLFFHNARGIYMFFVLSVSFVFLGSFLIIQSLFNININEDKLNNNIYSKIHSRFNIHADFSSFIKERNNIINDSINTKNNSNEFDNYQQVSFNSGIVDSLENNIHDIKVKKEKFISTILPYIIEENETVLSERKKIFNIREFLIKKKTLNKEDQIFIEKIANKYKINTHNKHKLDILESLLIAVDQIPNSIVLAQAANESGWGTSRFAQDYNAFFGEYTFDINSGVVPIFRENGDKHLVKFFNNVQESVGSYFINLNTHPAYKEFRNTRKELRINNEHLDPNLLVNYLEPYAKDKNYVKTIKSIIETNKLIKFDKFKSIIRNS